MDWWLSQWTPTNYVDWLIVVASAAWGVNMAGLWFKLMLWYQRPFGIDLKPMSVAWRLEQHHEKTGKDHR
jgi:hypothetical protein